jgi:hypothetical protein
MVGDQLRLVVWGRQMAAAACAAVAEASRAWVRAWNIEPRPLARVPLGLIVCQKGTQQQQQQQQQKSVGNSGVEASALLVQA